MLISRQNIREKYFFFLPKNKIFDSRAGHKWSVSSANKSFPLQSIPWLSQIHHFVPPPVSVGQQQFPHPFPLSGMPMPHLDCRGTGVVPTFVNNFVFAILATCLSSGKLFTKCDREWRRQHTFHAAHGFFYSKNQEFEYLIRNACHLFRTLTKTLTFVH